MTPDQIDELLNEKLKEIAAILPDTALVLIASQSSPGGLNMGGYCNVYPHDARHLLRLAADDLFADADTRRVDQ